MDMHKFEHLIAHLETEAHIAPRKYAARVGLLAAAGYGYIFLILGGSIFALVKFSSSGIAYIPLKIYAGVIIFLLGLIFFILRSLMVRMDPPEGIEVKPADAPELFRMLEKIRARLKGPKIHKVLLDNELNAGITQIPRLGMLGWNRNYLVIGMPLLQTFGVPHAAAILAHEYGHLAGSHGAFASWIYRIRHSWEMILVQLHLQDHMGRHLFTWFYDWYVPYFMAYTFVFARANEYDADRAAAEVAGAANAAAALVLAHIHADFLGQRFWPNYLKGVNDREAPLMLPHTQMRMAFTAGRNAADEKRWLKSALTEGTGLADTHPCLTDRLASLGEEAVIPGALPGSAAEALFGNRLKRFIGLLDNEWKHRNQHVWREQYEEAQKDKARLVSLNERVARGEGIAPLYQLARAELTERFHGAASALPLYREVLDKSPALPEAHLALGRLLAEHGSADAVPHLDAAMKGDNRHTALASYLAYRVLLEQGRRTDADRYMQKLRDLRVAEQDEYEEQAREYAQQA